MATKPTMQSVNGRPKIYQASMDRAKFETSCAYQDAWKRLEFALSRNRELSLEQARNATLELCAMGDFDGMLKAILARLPYEHARKEPEPPAPTGRVSAEPIEELTEEEFCKRHGVTREPE